MKTPEQYLTDSLALPDEDGGEYTPEERLFLEKYLGASFPEERPSATPAQSPPQAREEVPASPEQKDTPPLSGKAPAPVASSASETQDVHKPAQKPQKKPQHEVSRKDQLKQEQILQFVSFHIHRQKFALPVGEVQEVIRYVEPTRIPTAPGFIAGMINLRGRVTPLIRLDKLFRQTGSDENSSSFIVICRGDDLQFGLLVHGLSTMYRVPRDEIEWNIEARLGTGSDCLTALFRDEDQIIGIIALDQLVRKVLDE
ncbi:MAG: chemotaxis protein CheW [Desulfovibrionales bacterium]